MSSPNSIPGLSFRKLDLHVHTPASRCFEGDCLPQDIVSEALAKGLEGIAITDHNSGAWIDRVQLAAKGTGLVVFPGVELSCTGGKKCIHIIGLFDIHKDSKHIEAVLNVLGINPDDYDKQDVVTTKGPVEVIETIYDRGGIPVLAHSNSSNGVLADMSGQPRIKVVQCKKLMAAEGTDYFEMAKAATKKRVVDLLNGKDPDYQRKLAVYQASDNPSGKTSGRHGVEGIGSRFSLFKLEMIDLDGLRQCMLDSEVRISHEKGISAPDYPRIKSVRFNSGFLENQEIQFHDGLTTILGAKGAGKSLLIEFIRFVLNQEPRDESIAQDHVAKLRSRLGEYGTVEIAFVDDNGKEWNISRTFRELDGSPFPPGTPFDPAQVFPVLFLSQNEIIRIAENEDEQLQFIDQFFDFRSIRTTIESIEGELEILDRKMAEALETYPELENLQTQAKTVASEIQSLDTKLRNPVFEAFKQLQLKEQALTQQRDYLSSLISGVEKARETVLARVAPTIPAPLEADPSVLRANDAISRARTQLADQLRDLAFRISTERDKAKAEYDSWYSQYLSGKKQYEENIQTMGGDYKALALTRERTVRELNDIRRRIDQLEARKKEVPELSKRRNELLDALQEQYDLYTHERKVKCEKFQTDSGGKLRLNILGSSNVDEFRTGLLSLKRGSYLRDEEIEAITAGVSPREFVISLLRYDALKETKYLQSVATASNIALARMKTLADFLLNSIPYESLLALQYKAIPQDRPEILYNIGNDTYQLLSDISVGQKCTAMLLMALSEGTMPIVIDQPEDSLDIRSIWEDMCTKLRVGKQYRQFIFTTHNSSLAVASDTDCYMVIEGDASRGRLVHVGSMDHDPMTSEVLKYLEGGKETYGLKSRKYKIGQN